jgi:hypothetical protein
MCGVVDMPRKKNLAEALQKVAQPNEVAVPPVARSLSGSIAPSREGKKAITGFFDPAVSRQLKQIALEEDSNIQALLREALNDLFSKRGRSPIA